MAELAYQDADFSAVERFGQIPETLHAGARGQQNPVAEMDQQQLSFQMNRGRLLSLQRQLVLRAVLKRLAVLGDGAIIAAGIARQADRRAQFH